MQVETFNDDWPIDRPDPNGDDLLTGEVRASWVLADGWGVRLDYRVITDRWDTNTRADEGEAVAVSPIGVEFGALLVGNLGGASVQRAWHQWIGEPYTGGEYPDRMKVRPLVCYRDHGEFWFADTSFWGDGWRAAAGPRVQWQDKDSTLGGTCILTARVGVCIEGGNQLSTAGEAWRSNGEPWCALLTMQAECLLLSLEWSEGQVRGGIGATF